jgi:hypothetical protein
MADLSIRYKGAEIVSLSESASKTLLTAGKYCEDNIVIDYVRPSSGDEIWGLIATIEVPTNVNSFSTELPRTAIEGGIIWEVMHNVTFSYPDYYYAAVLPDGLAPGDNSGYSARVSGFDGDIMIYSFREAMTINGLEFPGVTGSNCLTSNFSRLRRLQSTAPFTHLVRKLYSSDRVFTGGTIDIYGRIS